MKPTTSTTKPVAAPKKTKRDLFTLSNEDLANVSGGQGIVVTGPQK